MVTKFKNHLARTNLARNTINSYVWAIEYFLNHYGEVNKRNLLAYKGYLVENFKPQTVNLRLQGINKYLEFTKQEKLKVKFVKVQQKNFLENVISDADYKFLKARLKTDGYDEWYFIVWFMAATGARVSELLHIKAEHIGVGYLDLYSKGGKIRRLYIPKTLRTEADKWLKGQGLTSGYIFLNRFGQRITTRGIASQLKNFAEKYGMNKFAIAGGVASNSALRQAMQEACEKRGVKFYHPSPIFCTDNAAMIGVAAYYEYLAGTRHGLDLNAVPNLKLGER